jgi:hypothetical protein
MQLTDAHKLAMAEGRKRYHEKLRSEKAKGKPQTKLERKLERWEQRAIAAQGGEPEDTNNKEVRIVPAGPRHPLDFEHMSLEELRSWLTDARKHWDEAVAFLRQKEAEYSAEHTSVDCACGCGERIDLSRGRFASSEAYRDPATYLIKTRYWATMRCVQAYRLAQSPEYKEQLRKEMEKKIEQHIVKSGVLEA